ncbi:MULTISPECIES: Ger(x)C family spore germination protein [unclassified Paenibacillus]|uniref:Ger(x)C family spore germination protein n=1 Tax=unclassified Paenibacillus TaxID=185978 RepID=UPI000837B080|nr:MULTISPECIES: Ger(x)C family spore germination protein [unclassified Paenibacillus]NWL86238.1 Ger(x)C family spore germination protein [Paenibacillus sp. 79R4]
MKRFTACLFLLLMASTLLTGCWNRRELNELAIAVGLGLDKDGDGYQVSVQVVNPSEVSSGKGGGESPATLYTAKGHTVSEAIRRISNISPRKIYVSQLRMALLGQSLADTGVAEALDFLLRDHELRTDFYLAVVKNASAEDALKIMTPLQKIPANKLFASLETSEQTWAPSLTETLNEMISDLLSDGKQPVLPGIRILGDPEIGAKKQNIEGIDTPTQLKFTGIAAFKRDKVVGWLTEDQSKGYNFIRGNIKNTMEHAKCPDGGKLSFEVINSKTKSHGKVIQGKPQIDIDVKISGNIADVECKNLNLLNVETIEMIEHLLNERIKSIMEDSIHTVQQNFGADIFGFGEVVHRSNPRAWKELRHDWDERYFRTLPVNIKVSVKIQRLGTTKDSFLKNMKE